MVIRDFEQKSPEWFELKYRKIGGTRIKDLLVNKSLKDTALFKHLFGENNEEFYYDEEDQPYLGRDVERGNELEPFALETIEKVKGVKFVPTAWIQSDYEILGLSPDGVNEDETIGAEAKCLSRAVHGEYVREAESFKKRSEVYIPVEFNTQVVGYFAASKTIHTVYFILYRPEFTLRPYYIATVKRDSLIPYNYTAKSGYKFVKVSDKVLTIHNKAVEMAELVKKEVNNLMF